MAISLLPTPEQLRQLVIYDPESGQFQHRERGPEWFSDRYDPAYWANWWNARFAGKMAFKSQNKSGYLTATLGPWTLLAHRAAWAIHHDHWPRGEVDHINGNPADNRIANLRDVDRSTNQRNKKLRSDNTSGCQGVQMHKASGLWRAQIGKTYLGYFKHYDDAVNARKAAEVEFGYHRNHGRLHVDY